jgi:hypothetical protein
MHRASRFAELSACMRSSVLLAAIILSACTMNGHRDENGQIDLGPNAMGDDPIYHAAYPSYAEYAVATHEFDDLAKKGYSNDQQTCVASALVNSVPEALRKRLNDYATGKAVLMESEYARLYKELGNYTGDKDFIRSIKPQLDRCVS